MLNAALNAMVRMTVKICLFTLSFVLCFTLAGKAEGFPVNHELPINLNELMQISESVETPPSNRWEVIGLPNCQLFSGMLNPRRDHLQPTCPISLIILTGKQQDPYWQYYADCDRWGVEFTNLLIDARTIGNSVGSLADQEGEVITELTEASDLDFDSPGSRFSITRFLISQNVSYWLEPSQFEKQVSFSLLEWLRVAEFNSIESLGIESELLVGTDSAEANPLATACRTIGSSSLKLSLADQIERISIGLKNLVVSIQPYSTNHSDTHQTSIDSGRTTQSK